MNTAVYPGSFDPPTYGHLDVVKRGSQIFDTLIIAVAVNDAKQYLFSPDERRSIMTEATRDVPNVEVEIFEGMIIDFVQSKDTNVILRGIRTVSDFEYEFKMALTNREMARDIETLFVMTDQRYSFFSSSLTKEVASLGGPVERFVPDFIADMLREKLT
jgi:pantetheine-phosphate adenylyltransferase